MGDEPKSAGVLVTDHIEGLRERAAAAFNLASAHARMADTMMRLDPSDPSVVQAVIGARDAMRAALNLFNGLSAARQEVGHIVAESERAQRQGEMQ